MTIPVNTLVWFDGSDDDDIAPCYGYIYKELVPTFNSLNLFDYEIVMLRPGKKKLKRVQVCTDEIHVIEPLPARPEFQQGDSIINLRNELFGTVVAVDGDEVVGSYVGTDPVGHKLFVEKTDNVARVS
jgi:hypothetical protein